MNQLEIIKAMLEAGHDVDIPASGYSMFPTFLPGDIIRIKPLHNVELPVPGTVVVYQSAEKFVLHRFTGLISDEVGNILFKTRGDSMMLQDEPWMKEQLIGEAVNFRRGKKERKVETRLPSKLRYKINSGLLWVYGIINRGMRIED